MSQTARHISYSRGKGKLRHNNRDIISSNVDKARTQDNIIFKQQSLAEAYAEIFGKAQEAYNAKQKRKDRKVKDYFVKLFGQEPTDTILTNKNEQQSFYEYVVGIGDMHNTGFKDNPEMAAVAVECLREYMNGFQERNPNFHVFNAVIHMDESTPHLHYDFIPYSDGYKTGMTRQQGIAKALECMDYGKGKDAIHNFTQTERQIFRSICEKHGIEVAPEEKGRGYTIPTRIYGQVKELEKQAEEARQKVQSEELAAEAARQQRISEELAADAARQQRLSEEKAAEAARAEAEAAEQKATEAVQKALELETSSKRHLAESQSAYEDRIKAQKQAEAVKQRTSDLDHREKVILQKEAELEQVQQHIQTIADKMARSAINAEKAAHEQTMKKLHQTETALDAERHSKMAAIRAALNNAARAIFPLSYRLTSHYKQREELRKGISYVDSKRRRGNLAQEEEREIDTKSK